MTDRPLQFTNRKTPAEPSHRRLWLVLATIGLTVYALVVGKNGPKLNKARDNPGGAGLSFGESRLEAHGITLDRLCDTLGRLYLHRPVLNMTEMAGNFDIVLAVSMHDMGGLRSMTGPGPAGGAEAGPAPEGTPSASIFTAIQQLGLKLEPRQAPIEYVVVDSANKVPTEN